MRVLRQLAALKIARILAAAALVLLLTGCGPQLPEIRVEPSAAPSAAPSEAVRAVSETVYVLNPASVRFHRPDCVWAAKIAPERRLEWTGDREELLSVGYEPCRICKP